MTTQRFYPSSYYPEYFKADIDLGGKHEFPFSTGLDHALYQFLCSHFLNLSMICEQGVEASFMKNFLLRTGFHLENLSEEQVRDLYYKRSDLFSLRGTLAGLDELAKIHFGQIHSHHGLPFKNQQIHEFQLTGNRISERSNTCRWITYRIESISDLRIVDTFLKNSELFLPRSIKIYIQMKKHETSIEDLNRSLKEATRFKSSFRLYSRSIPCRTSLK
jgi:hypothetical protein